MDKPKPLKLITVIVNRGKGKKVTKLFNKNAIDYHIATVGIGTAPTELLGCFGLGESEKEVVFCVVPEDRTGELFTLLKEELSFDKPNTGIAFSVPVASVCNMAALQFILNGKKES